MQVDDSIAAWVRLARTGDPAAQQTLWERFFPQLVRIARRKLEGQPRGLGDEEDVVLSVFQSFFRGISEQRFPDLQSSDSLWRLLSWMTHKKAVDWLRYANRQKRAGAGESAMKDSPKRFAVQSLDRLPGDDPTPVFAAILAEECQQLLARLQPNLRDVALAKFDGYTNQEIAVRQQCSLATIERQLKLVREIWSRNP